MNEIHLQSFIHSPENIIEDSFYEYHYQFLSYCETNYSRLHIYQRFFHIFNEYMKLWIMTRRSLPISKEIFYKWNDIVLIPIRKFIKELIHHGITFAEMMFHINTKKELLRYQQKLYMHEHFHGFIFLQKIVISNSWKNKKNRFIHSSLLHKSLRY